MTKGCRRAIIPLALNDLRHEFVMNLCLILALAAVLTPLLLLMGLKYGTVETMRERLLQDPVYREIKPRETLRLPLSWFDRLSGDPDVAFLVPTILRGASIVRVGRHEALSSELVDMVPSASGDPLIEENGLTAPRPGEAVISLPLASKIDVALGDPIDIKISRVVEGRRQRVVEKLRVAGILPVRADGALRIYVDAPLAFDAESYRDGSSVPSRGWEGKPAPPPQSFDGIMLAAPKPLPASVREALTEGTGATVLAAVSPETFTKVTGITAPAEFALMSLRAASQPLGIGSVQSIRDRLSNTQVAVLPFLDAPPEAVVGGDFVVPVRGFSPTAKDLGVLGNAAPTPPWGPLDKSRDFKAIAQIMLPADVASVGDKLQVRVGGDGTPTVLVRAAATSGKEGGAFVPAELLGELRTARDRPVTLDPELGLLVGRASFRGFRLYARDLEAVPRLHSRLEAEGLPVSAQLDVIERIHALDHGLSRMFAIIAMVGLTGASAALVANFYASVDRKKRDLAMLRLLGMERAHIWCLPLVQALVLGGLASGLALSAYLILAHVINGLFPDNFDLGSEICRLPPELLAGSVLAATAISGASSLIAAWKSSRLQPAEMIRVE